MTLFVCFLQMRVPSSPNQSANPSTPWEAEPVVEESGIVEDANAENLYLMGSYLPLLLVLLNTWYQMWCHYCPGESFISFPFLLHPFPLRDGAVRGSTAKVGAGPEYSSSHPLNLQQQQPRFAGGNVWRPSCGKPQSLPHQLVLKFFYVFGILYFILK